MIISEKELEDMIFNADREELENRGLWMPKNLRRQVRIGNYGIADIVGFERGCMAKGYQSNSTIYVYELKKDEIDISTFMQSIRYAKGITSYFRHKKYLNLNISIVLIGGTINMASDFLYLPDILSCEDINLELYTYSLNFNGIFFKSHYGYGLRDEGFNIKAKPISNKDFDFTDF
jgi:hypothetical protein